MRMIPASPHKTDSTAEKKVFDILRRVFDGPHYSDYVGFHSLNLTRHAKKRFGEIDFLIVCPLGILVLEIKGGRVSCSEGVWQYTNKTGSVNISYEGPFKQAESALHGLISKLREKISNQIVEEFSIGFGVILPDCKLTATSSEWDPQMVCDDGSHNDMERWLKGLLRYWRGKDSKERQASSETIKQVVQFLRPNFEAIIPLHSRLEDASTEVHRLTDAQMAFVDSMELNKRIICSGGAGTGKTFLAIEVARRWCTNGEEIALVCSSPWLMNYLKAKFSVPGLTVCTLQGLNGAARRVGIEKFAALIVDEGQDLLSMEQLAKLDSSVTGGLENGRWVFFHDANNQAGLFGEVEPDALEYLNSLDAFRIPLKRNCRNTKVILDKIKNTTGADTGVLGAGMGAEVVELHASSVVDAAQLVEKEIQRIVVDGGVSESNVTILVHSINVKNFVDQLSSKTRQKILYLDEYSMKSFPPSGISISDISNFKGLENEVIIVVGTPEEIKNDVVRANVYVAYSRAKALLSVINL